MHLMKTQGVGYMYGRFRGFVGKTLGMRIPWDSHRFFRGCGLSMGLKSDPPTAALLNAADEILEDVNTKSMSTFG